MARKQERSNEDSKTPKETDKSKAVINRNQSDSYIFGQLGFMLHLFVSSGGEVEIKRPKRKRTIDGRNSLDVLGLKLKEFVFLRQPLVEEEMKKFPEKDGEGKTEKSERTRTIRKNVNDILFNVLANICKWLCPSIGTRLAKRSSQPQKQQRIKFASINYNGVVLTEKRINELGRDWLIDVLAKLGGGQEDIYYISSETIVNELLVINDLLSPEGEEVGESIENIKKDIQNGNNDVARTVLINSQVSHIQTQNEIQNEDFILKFEMNNDLQRDHQQEFEEFQTFHSNN